MGDDGVYLYAKLPRTDTRTPPAFVVCQTCHSVVVDGDQALHTEWHDGRPLPVALSERQAQIVDGLRRGLTTRQIAVELGIAAKTVENHKTRLFDKLGAETAAHAVALAGGAARG